MIFLDSASTTKPYYFSCDYSKAWLNSNMDYAEYENDILEKAKNRIKDCLNVTTGKILFFRCATEAAEWLMNKMNEHCCCITQCSEYEHDSVYYVCSRGEYNVDAVSHQYVNQLTGEIFPFTEELTDEHCFNFSDLTAAIGHVEIPVNMEKVCDAVWFSGHKFHCEKGIGAMWISDRLAGYLGASDNPKNQYDLVHGTLNVAGCCALADAMKEACCNIETKMEDWAMLAGIITRDLHNAGIECSYVADDRLRTNAINALRINGVDADALQLYLATTKKIYVGKGSSACADSKDYRVLNAYGLSNAEASEVIRISFDEYTTIKEVKALVEAIIDFYKNYVE